MTIPRSIVKPITRPVTIPSFVLGGSQFSPSKLSSLWFQGEGGQVIGNRLYSKATSQTGVDARCLREGQAIVLTGTEYGIVNANPVVDINTPWEIQISASDTSGTFDVLYSEGSSVTATPFFAIRTGSSANTLEIFWRNNSSTTLANQAFSSVFSGSSARNIRVVYNGVDEIEVFVNDVSEGTISITPSGSMSTNLVTLGALRRTTVSDEFSGKLWRLRTYADGVEETFTPIVEESGSVSYDVANDSVGVNWQNSPDFGTQLDYNYVNEYGYNLSGSVVVPASQVTATEDVLGNPLDNEGKAIPSGIIRGNNAIAFDGINQSADIGTITSASTSGSCAMLVKLDNAIPAGAANGLADVGRAAANSSATHYPFGDGNGYFSIFRATRVNAVPLSSDVDRTQWHWVIFTSEPGANGWKFYQNKELIHQTTGDASIDWSGNPTKFGINNGTSIRFDGEMAQPLVYDRVLSQSEIDDLVDFGIVPQTGRLIDAPFAEGNGRIAWDRSGNNYDLQLQNSPTRITQDVYPSNLKDGHSKVPYFTGGSNRIDYTTISGDYDRIEFTVLVGTEVTAGSSFAILGGFGASTVPYFGFGSITGVATDETFTIASAGTALTYIKDTIPIGKNTFVLEWNGSSYDISINGVAKTTFQGTTHATKFSDTTLQIGSRASGGGGYVGGIRGVNIQDSGVEIFNAPLNQGIDDTVGGLTGTWAGTEQYLRVPAASTTLDANGMALGNPPASETAVGFNDAESTIDFINISCDGNATVESAHLVGVTPDMSSFGLNEDVSGTDQVFYDDPTPYLNTKITITTQDLTGTDLTQMINYAGAGR